MATSLYSLAELEKCAQREVKIRKRVYPTRVANGRMSAHQAAREIAMMAAIHAAIKAQLEKERLL